MLYCVVQCKKENSLAAYSHCDCVSRSGRPEAIIPVIELPLLTKLTTFLHFSADCIPSVIFYVSVFELFQVNIEQARVQFNLLN